MIKKLFIILVQIALVLPAMAQPDSSLDEDVKILTDEIKRLQDANHTQIQRISFYGNKLGLMHNAIKERAERNLEFKEHLLALDFILGETIPIAAAVLTGGVALDVGAKFLVKSYRGLPKGWGLPLVFLSVAISVFYNQLDAVKEARYRTMSDGDLKSEFIALKERLENDIRILEINNEKIRMYNEVLKKRLAKTNP